MLWVQQTIYFPSWEEEKTFPTLMAEESFWLVMAKETSTESIGPQSQPLTPPGIFVQTPAPSFSLPLSSADLNQRNNGEDSMFQGPDRVNIL